MPVCGMAILDAKVITELLDAGRNKRLKRIIADADSVDLAVLTDQLSDHHKIALYVLIPTKISSEVLLEVSSHSRKFILKSLKDKYIISIIERAESDDSADILGEVPVHKVKRIFSKLPKAKREAIVPLTKYEDDTAGGIMQSELIALPTTLTVKQAIKEVKQELTHFEGVNYVYIVDKAGRLKGVVTIQDLLIASEKRVLGSVMKKDVVTLAPNLDKEKVAEVFRHEDLIALPVVDKDKKLLGRITVDDVLDVMEEEATEDMFKIAGVHPDENVFDPVRRALRKRLPWLVVNLITAIFAAFTISLFSDTIESVVILAAFMPLIAGMGGNAGTQTLTLIIRGFALNHLNLTNYKKVLRKEVALGFINGVIIGLIMGIIALLWTGNLMMGVVILLSMIITLTVAGSVGTVIPLLLERFKIDPAVASTVFVTTFTDVIGFFAFLGIATVLIHWLV